MELLKAHLRPLFYLLNKFFLYGFLIEIYLCGEMGDDGDVAPIH